MKSTADQSTFWQFTMENAKEAVRLYFRPVQQVASWLTDEREPVDTKQVEKALREERVQLDALRESTSAQLSTLKEKQDLMEVRLRDLERQLNPSFDSLEDLQLRVNRLTAWVGSPSGSTVETDVKNTVSTITAELATAQLLKNSPVRAAEAEQVLAHIRHRLRQMEVYLGFEGPLHVHRVERTKGASGD